MVWQVQRCMRQCQAGAGYPPKRFCMTHELYTAASMWCRMCVGVMCKRRGICGGSFERLPCPMSIRCRFLPCLLAGATHLPAVPVSHHSPQPLDPSGHPRPGSVEVAALHIQPNNGDPVPAFRQQSPQPGRQSFIHQGMRYESMAVPGQEYQPQPYLAGPLQHVLASAGSLPQQPVAANDARGVRRISAGNLVPATPGPSLPTGECTHLIIQLQK
jgi:hypothetical protein